MKKLIIGVSWVGFCLSLFIHIISLVGIEIPNSSYGWMLHFGILVVWFPTVLIIINLTKGRDRFEFLQIALKGCPGWIKKALLGIFIYTIINFVLFALSNPGSSQVGMSGYTPPSVFRGFSGLWMFFYFAAFAVSYSALHNKNKRKM